jgi:hypothetical protein
MNETAWKWGLGAVTTDLQLAAQFAAAIATDPTDAPLWNNAIPLRPIGSQDTEPTAWGVDIPCRIETHQAALEYSGAGPYPILNGKGIADQAIAYAKTKMWASTIECSPPRYTVTLMDDLAATLGYERIPEAA